MTKDNSTGKNKEFYDLGKKMFDRLNPQIAHNPEVVGYVAPQREWVGLTDDDMQDVIQAAMHSITGGDNTFTLSANKVWVAIVREVEAKLKERNT